jgi:hypothetical protein
MLSQAAIAVHPFERRVAEAQISKSYVPTLLTPTAHLSKDAL